MEYETWITAACMLVVMLCTWAGRFYFVLARRGIVFVGLFFFSLFTGHNRLGITLVTVRNISESSAQ